MNIKQFNALKSIRFSLTDLPLNKYNRKFKLKFAFKYLYTGNSFLLPVTEFVLLLNIHFGIAL